MYQTKDIPTASQENNLASRLRAKRDELGMTRKQVKEETGIPQNSIEKFENGSQEPTVSRLLSLAKLYNVTVDCFLNGEEEEQAKSLKGFTSSFHENDETEENHEELTETPAETVRAMLNEIDQLRKDGFKNAQRYALALAKDTTHMMTYLETDELESLALERELHQENKKGGFEFTKLFKENPHQAHVLFVGNVADRITDTAILGIDLYKIDLEVLAEIADKLNAENRLRPKGEFSLTGWGEHEEIVPLLRTALRAKSVSSNSIDFSNLEVFLRQ